MNNQTVLNLPQELLTLAPLVRRFPLSIAARFAGLYYPEPSRPNPVLLIPGLGATPSSMYWLKHELMQKGYRVYSSRLFRNEGSFEAQGPELQKQVAEITHRNMRPVDIVGWSMGGRYAVRLADTTSPHIGKLITLGSPLFPTELSPEMEQAWRIGLFFAGIPISPIEQEMGRHCPLPDGTHPLSTIVGQFDAVVPFESSAIPESHCGTDLRRENIHVGKGHLALGFSSLVRDVILDRLAEPLDTWRLYAAKPH